jgi:chloramphenicol 3-O-phosphotransferase
MAKTKHPKHPSHAPSNEDIAETPVAKKTRAPVDLKALEATVARHRMALAAAAVPGAARLSHDALGQMAESLSECETVLSGLRDVL